jgi:putative DNA primase/helicase
MTSSSATDYLHQRRADGAACLEQARRYLRELGWSVLAVCPPDHLGVGKTHGQHCQSPGKAPWGPWKEFQDRLPTIGEILRKWHDNAMLNLGLALGPVSRLIRVDVDGPAGEERLRRVSGGIVPVTLEFISGRKQGGRGLLYQIPLGAELRTTIERRGEPKQELRFQAKGAQTVLPPSRHPEGCLYAWVPGRSPWEMAPALAPDWLLAQLRPGHRSGHRLAPHIVAGEKITEGHRDTELTSMAGVMRRRGFSAKAIAAALLVENELRCDPPLDKDQVEKIAESVGRYAPGERPIRFGNAAFVCSEVEV